MIDITAAPTPAIRWKAVTGWGEDGVVWTAGDGKECMVLQQLWEIREGAAYRQEWRAVPEVAADAPDEQG